MSGHTKGPWGFGEGYVPGASTFDLFGLGGRQVIASASYENMWLARYDKDEDAANAHLIAAAPCMKAALTEARTTLAMLKRNVVTEIARHDGLLRWEGVPEAIQARIDECEAAITRADGGGK